MEEVRKFKRSEDLRLLRLVRETLKYRYNITI